MQILLGENVLNPVQKEYDTIICVDTSAVERMGKFEKLLNGAKLTFNIDHHITNELYAGVNIVENVSSTCELIYNILFEYGLSLSQQVKKALYTGIMTDTNNFVNTNFNKETLLVASNLVDGVNPSEQYKIFFLNKSAKDVEMLGVALKNLINIEDGKILISYITHKDMKKHKANQENLLGIVRNLTCVKDNVFACVIKPKDKHFQVSLRSKEGYNVAKISELFGGGGHMQASGFSSKLNIKKLVKALKVEFYKQLNK